MDFTKFLNKSLDNSLLAQLREDPTAASHAPNQRSREVTSGHYVRVVATPLRAPRLVAHGASLAAALGLTDAMVHSVAFRAYFAGNLGALKLEKLEAWATPYALSIYGSEMYDNCPFSNGNGYGDGRAASIGELVSPVDGARWELQLKGSGRTPFSRSGDGRAVLRSSVREFVASHAMHALGVPTTRPLSLIVDDDEVAVRQWYPQDATALAPPGTLRSERDPAETAASASASPSASASGGSAAKKKKRSGLLTADDPRLATFGTLVAFLSARGMGLRATPPDLAAAVPAEMRAGVASMLNSKLREQSDSVVLNTPVAIACRVAPSFLRVGQVELFARRARAPSDNPTARAFAKSSKSSKSVQLSNSSNSSPIGELFEMVEHVIAREFGAVISTPLPSHIGSSGRDGGGSSLEADELRAALASDPQCKQRYEELLRAVSRRLATLTSEWIRVGFVQGNFNSDNCLVGGCTMDYGPFGFLERFEHAQVCEQETWGRSVHQRWRYLGYPVLFTPAAHNGISFQCLLSSIFSLPPLSLSLSLSPLLSSPPLPSSQNFWGPSKPQGHFGFMNQGAAGTKNFTQFARAVATLIGKDDERVFLAEHVRAHEARVANALHAVWRAKLGFSRGVGESDVVDGEHADGGGGTGDYAGDSAGTVDVDNAAIDRLVTRLLPLLEKRADWTIFWRQLASLVPSAAEGEGDVSEERVANALRDAMYPVAGESSAPTRKQRARETLTAWVNDWRALHRSKLSRNVGVGSTNLVVTQMNGVNPKYIPRQWMLVDAYIRAQQNDYTLVNTLIDVLTNPYAEQLQWESRFFRKSPTTMYADLASEAEAEDEDAEAESLYREVMPS